MKYGFGIDLGGTTVKLAYFDETGNLLDKWEIPTDTSDRGSHILPDIAGAVLGYLKEKALPRESILGLGLGVPGPVRGDGTVVQCVNLGWGIFNVEQSLRELSGFPVKAGNDANVAALGEAWKGGGMGCQNMVMATLGTGVGGGIIFDGRVAYGAHGAAGEIGHMVLHPDETEPCGCGKYGCVEQYCSATGVVRTAKRYLEANPTSSPLNKEDLTCKDVFDAWHEGDPAAAAILEIVFDNLAQFLGNVCNVADPDLVLIGGGVSKAGQPLLDGILRYLPKYVFHATSGVKLALATLGNDAGAYGAFKLVLDAASE